MSVKNAAVFLYLQQNPRVRNSVYRTVSIYMFTLQICPKMNKSEKPPSPGVALSFGKVMKYLSETFIDEAM